jgi:hypothetical protein
LRYTVETMPPDSAATTLRPCTRWPIPRTTGSSRPPAGEADRAVAVNTTTATQVAAVVSAPPAQPQRATPSSPTRELRPAVGQRGAGPAATAPEVSSRPGRPP